MFLNRLTTRRTGESLIEVVIAVFVIAVGSGVAASLIVTALQSNSFSRDQLIGLNLAVEGVEAMRSIRDTNWLKYSFDRENCWNLRPDQVCTAPYDTKIIKSGFYNVNLDTNNVWQLSYFGDLNSNSSLDLNMGNLAVNQNYEMKVVNPQQSFTDLKFFTPQYGTTCSPPCIDLPSDPQNSRFYRMVKVTNIPSDNDVQALEIDVLVQWRSQGTVHNATLATQLTNYQKTN